MLRPLIRTGIVLAVLAWFFPTITFSSIFTLIIASVVMSILFGLLRPILKLVFLPINVVTLGFFSVVINVGLLWLATYLVPGFSIEPTSVFGVDLNGFFTLVLVSTLISFLQGILKFLI